MDFTIVYASELIDRIRKSNALLVDIREKEDYAKDTGRGLSIIHMMTLAGENVICQRDVNLFCIVNTVVEVCRWRVCWGRKAIRWQLLWEVMKQ